MTKADGVRSEVEIVEVEPRSIAIVRRTVAMADIPDAQREARRLLAEAMKAAGIEAGGRTLTLWRPPQAGMMDYAPGIFVPDTFGASGAVSLFTLPKGQAAHLRMDGPYTGLPDAWQQLFAESRTRGLALAGLNWEIYGAGDDAGADLFALLT